jgi:hypothetical protein
MQIKQKAAAGIEPAKKGFTQGHYLPTTFEAFSPPF